MRLLRAMQVHWRSGLKRPLDCNLLVSSEAGGRRRSLHLRGSSVLGEQGRPLRVAGSLSDVTLQRQHERELRALAALIEQHPDPLLVLGVPGRVEWINVAALQLLGASQSVLLGSSVPFLVRRLRARGVRAIRVAWRARQNWQGVIRITVGDAPSWLALSVGRIDGDSEAPRMLLSARRLDQRQLARRTGS